MFSNKTAVKYQKQYIVLPELQNIVSCSSSLLPIIKKNETDLGKKLHGLHFLNSLYEIVYNLYVDINFIIYTKLTKKLYIENCSC